MHVVAARQPLVGGMLRLSNTLSLPLSLSHTLFLSHTHSLVQADAGVHNNEMEDIVIPADFYEALDDCDQVSHPSLSPSMPLPGDPRGVGVSYERGNPVGVRPTRGARTFFWQDEKTSA